jgi:DNA repair protein RecO (recombination protein O)
MAYLTVTGIVTRYVNYKDNDRILTLFTREMGRIDARARGCRRPKSPLLACSQPFVFGEFQIFAGKERYTVDQCDVRETFYPLREDVDRFAVGSAMLALSQHAVQASEPNPELFSLLYHGLSFLCYGESAPIDIGLCFATRYVRTAGFCPVITSCAACGADLRAMRTLCFDSGAGGVLCDDCAKRSLETRDVSCLTLEAMRRMLLLEDKDMDRVRLPDTVRRELLALLEQYCAHVFERESRPLTALRKLLPSE